MKIIETVEKILEVLRGLDFKPHALIFIDAAEYPRKPRASRTGIALELENFETE